MRRTTMCRWRLSLSHLLNKEKERQNRVLWRHKTRQAFAKIRKTLTARSTHLWFLYFSSDLKWAKLKSKSCGTHNENTLTTFSFSLSYAVRVRIDHSINLIKFSISFKLSVRDKVGIGLMKIRFVCWLSSEDPRFWGKCWWHPEPSKSPFRRVEIIQFWDVCCRLHIYPKNLTFTSVIHTLYYFTNMVEKI